LANSEFLTNKEQGDWAEQIVFNAINRHSDAYRAIRYGRDDALSAGDPGFADFFAAYREELNDIGKKPDILIYRRSDLPAGGDYDLDDAEFVGKAIAAIEVRSSSFLSQRYSAFMETRNRNAANECARLRQLLLAPPYGELLSERNPQIHQLINHATADTFRELDFRRPTWSTTAELRRMTDWLRLLKEQIKILHKRDYLSITPKLEDLALVNRWIQHFGVRHYYLQVFFDKAFIIPFQRILEIASDPRNEGEIFSVEQDTKNQRKTTIKIDIGVCLEILGRIDMPEHRSALKELDRGRLLFYVTFQGGAGYLDRRVFEDAFVNVG
jgi:type II restriction enzyme